MATVIYYPGGPQDESETYDVPHLAYWVVNHAPRTDQLFICQGEISAENTVRPDSITDEILADPDVVFHISPIAFGPETWIPIIVSVVIGVASAFLFTPPDVPDVTNSNKSSSNAFQARTNEPRVNQRLPDIFGTEVKAYPDLWSTYSKFDRNKEFEISYMCLSVGDVDVDQATILDGDTLLADIDGTSAGFYAPFTSPNNGLPYLQIGDPINETLYAVRRSNEVDGATLISPNNNSISGVFTATDTGVVTVLDGSVDFTSFYEVGDNATLTDFYSFEFVPDSSPGADDYYYIRHDVSGAYEVLSVSQDVMTLDISGNTTPWSFFDGNEVRDFAYESLNKWRFTFGSPYLTRVNWDPSVSPDNDPLIGPFDCSDSDQIWLNFVAQQGIYKKKSSPVFFTIQFRVTITDLDSVATTEHIVEMTSNQEDAVQSTFEFAVPYMNATVTVERITPTDYDFDGNVVDEVKWRDLYLVNNVTQSDFGNVTTIQTKTRATDAALRQKDRKLSCRCTRYMTRPDGAYVASDEFADVVYALHTDPFIGRRSKESIDYVGLYALQEQMVAYYGRGRDPIRVGFTFDDDTYRYEDHLMLICDAVNVKPYQIGSTIKFHFEGPQSFSVQQFGHRSKVPGAEERRTRSLHPPEDFDGVELTYKDETTGDFETIYVPADKSATNPEVLEYKGCFIARNAQVRADRMRNKQIHQRISHEFSALDKARLLAQGQRIDVIDNTRYAPNSGYIDTVVGLTYYLSQPTNLAAGSTASIVLTKRDGSLEGIPVTIIDEESVLLDYAPSESPYVGYLADRTEYSLATDDVRSSLAMLVKTIEPRDTDDVKVTCINYSDNYYDGDLD